MRKRGYNFNRYTISGSNLYSLCESVLLQIYAG